MFYVVLTPITAAKIMVGISRAEPEENPPSAGRVLPDVSTYSQPVRKQARDGNQLYASYWTRRPK